ncbi:MAG: TonB-dependent receptor [Porticoccaceae bacterium]
MEAIRSSGLVKYSVKQWLILSMWVAVFTLGYATELQAERLYDIHIPALDSASALNRLAEQADVYLIFPYQDAKSRQANAVVGRYTVKTALELLLEGSGLVGSFSDSGVIKISVLEAAQYQKEKGTMYTEKTKHTEQTTLNKIKTKKTLLATLFGALFSGGGIQAVFADNPVVLNEIIVTAQKRQQNLQEVPISETVFDASALKNARIDTGTEIARQTPNLRVSLLGDESQPKFSLRGVSTAEFNLNAISPTGIFFDEVYVGASYLGGAQIFDIERVEVLRGPQGTLFGKNTTAGAINFISQSPTFERGGYVTVGAGSNGYDNYKGAVELPLVDDRLSARFAFTGEHSDGYIKNLNPQGRDLSSIDRQGYRLTLGYRDDNGLDATLRLFKAEGNSDAIGAINTGLFPGGVNAAGVNPRVHPFTGQPLARDEVFTDRSGVIEVRGDGAYLTVNKELGNLTLTSITSYVEGRFLNLVDGDATFLDLLHLNFGVENEEISQDFRLTSNNDGPFNWIAGLYYYQDDVDVNTTFALFNDPLFQGAGVVLDQSYNQKRESYAIYGDISYEFGDIYTLYAGLRYTDDEGTLKDFAVAPFIPRQSDEVTYDDGEPTGRLGLQAQVTEDVMLYGQVVQGYRSSAINGGALDLNALTVAEPEKLLSYEAGIKSSWFERRLIFNASAFYYDFEDQQFINVVGIGQQQLVNAGKSRITGVEIETAVQATENFSLRAGLGLLDSEYKTLILNGQDLSGNDLIEAPDYTFNIAADYRVPLKDMGSMNFHVDATRVASQYFLATNDPFSEVDAFWDLGAVIAYRTSDEKLEVTVYGKNLTDNDESSGLQADPTTGTLFSTVPYPRRFGVEVTVNF